jgi:hypothetical protein
MTKVDGKPANSEKTGSRDKRLAAALRENLRRRKAQACGRSASSRPIGKEKEEAEAAKPGELDQR